MPRSPRPPRSTPQPHQVIRIQAEAAAKPPLGAPCNGCGVCCLAEPCPLGVLLSRSRVGPCRALQWVQAERQYRCGGLGLAGGGLARLRNWLVRRWIAAGAGCDCDLQPVPSRTIKAPSPHDRDLSHD